MVHAGHRRISLWPISRVTARTQPRFLRGRFLPECSFKCCRHIQRCSRRVVNCRAQRASQLPLFLHPPGPGLVCRGQRRLWLDILCFNCSPFEPNIVSTQEASAPSTFSIQAAVRQRRLLLQPPHPPPPPRCPSPCVRTTAAPAAALAAMQSTTLAIAALTAFILLQTSAPISLNQSAGPVLPTTFAPWAHLSQRHAPMAPFPQQAPRAAYQGAPVRRAMSSRLLLGAALPPSFSFTQASS